MTLLKDNNYKEINVALLSLEADIKNKITNFDTSVIDKQLAEINSRIDKINAGGNNTSAEINDIRYEIEDIKKVNSAKIENIEQKLSDIFSAENKVTDFNTTTDSGIYYWIDDAANRPGTNYGVLLVNKYDSGSNSIWINQIAYGTNSKIYFRQNINSSNWTEWKAVAFDGEGTAKKVANALTVNGKTYDGSSAVNAGVQKIENGGTGVTTQADINKAFIGNLDIGNSDVTDGTEFVSSWASDNGFNETTEGAVNKPYKRQFIKVWNYIKDKISSVLGLTKDNYGGKASTAGNADTVDNYHASQLWRSDGATWNPSANVTMTPSGNDSEWSFDFRNKNGATGLYWQVWDENKQTLLRVNADDGKVYAPYGFVGNLSGKADTAGTADSATNARTNADQGYLCKLYQLAFATQTYNVILLGKIPDPASTEAPATPSASWDIDVDFYFVRPTGHKASWCNVKAGYGYSNAWRKYGLIETFGVDVNSNYTNPFYLVTVKYNNEYYIGVRHSVNIDGSYAARVKYVNIGGNKNPSTVDNTPLVNMLKVIPYQKTTDGTILNNEIKTSIADFPNTYAPAVERNGDLVLKSGYVRIGASGVAGSKLTIHGATVNSNSYTDTNPKLEFKNDDGSQNISLTFTDYDSVQAPASLTLNGNQGNEYFIAPNIKATTKFIGNLTGNVTGNVTGSSGSAGKLTTPRTTYVNLGAANTSTSVDWSGTTTIPVDGVLAVENGGTGCNTAQAAADKLIANLPASNDVPVDTDYIISQVVNGGPFVPGYERRPISKLWEYIKGKILQEGEDFGYNHIVYDDASLLEWANCTDGSMKKVLIKSGTYNMTKGVDFSKAGTGYVFAENGAVINSKVPIAFSAPSGKTAVHNLSVICGPSSDNSCAFSANDVLNLILYDCDASYATNTITVDRHLFSKCTCYNCHYNFTYSSSNSSMSIKVFYQCYCYNCICKQTIAANSSSAVSFATNSFFYMECVCVSCDAELTILRNIKAATPSFSCYYNCWDRCVGCLSTINVNSKALTVYSTLYGFLRCQHMSSCKEVHTVGYSNIKGVVQCIYISSTSAVSGESNTSVGNSCDI